MRARRRPAANGTSRSRTSSSDLASQNGGERSCLQGLCLELHQREEGRCDIFGKRRGRIFKHIGIRDPREDFYAGRMTVATELLALGASDHVREFILGHEHGSVINRHYTQANLELMKSFLDRINLGLAIEVNARRGFP